MIRRARQLSKRHLAERRDDVLLEDRAVQVRGALPAVLRDVGRKPPLGIGGNGDGPGRLAAPVLLLALRRLGRLAAFHLRAPRGVVSPPSPALVEHAERVLLQPSHRLLVRAAAPAAEADRPGQIGIAGGLFDRAAGEEASRRLVLLRRRARCLTGLDRVSLRHVELLHAGPEGLTLGVRPGPGSPVVEHRPKRPGLRRDSRVHAPSVVIVSSLSGGAQPVRGGGLTHSSSLSPPWSSRPSSPRRKPGRQQVVDVAVEGAGELLQHRHRGVSVPCSIRCRVLHAGRGRVSQAPVGTRCVVLATP